MLRNKNIMEILLSNHQLKAKINTLGAELCSLSNNNIEYIWNADPLFWGRHSPVLFPVVGRLKNKQYTYQGTVYPMEHHGFARDKEFSILQSARDNVWFRLSQDEDTLRIYPFHFLLDIGYKLYKNKMEVIYRVTNSGNSDMYFFIGAHPAFNCPLNSKGQWDYYLDFHTKMPLYYKKINADNLVVDEPYLLPCHNGYLKMEPDMFDQDVLIFQNTDINQIHILNNKKEPYLGISFNAPVIGLWSPIKLAAPFICLEPWYGCNDSVNADDHLESRPFIQKLLPLQVFHTKYVITIY